MYKEAFAELGVEPGFEIEDSVLEANYLARQAIMHPDRFVTGLPAERTLAEIRASQLNQAYGLLKNPVTRAECLLVHRGIDYDQPASPTLLAEMMSWREGLAVVESPQALADIDQKITAAFEATVAQFAKTHTAEVFQRLRYLDKLRQEVKSLHARAAVRTF